MQRRSDPRARQLSHSAFRSALTIPCAILLVLAVAGPATAQSAMPLAYDVLPVGRDGAPVFVGTAEPGATVELLDGAIVVATGIANDRGEWILAAPGPAANPDTLTVRVTSPGGRFQTFPTVPPAIDAPPVGIRLTATLAADHLEGTAPPATTIAIAGIGPTAIEAIADGEGRWTVALPPLPAGAYSLTITADRTPGAPPIELDLVVPLDRARLAVTVTLTPVAVANAFGTLAGPRFVIVGPRDTLWDIAVRAYGDGTRYGEIFAANRDQLRDPRRIFAGQVLLIP